MSWMKGDLLSKSRRLVGGLATRQPVWLKAMEASPPPVFPCSNGKINKIVLPEDPYVRRFANKHPVSKIDDPVKISAFIPDPAHVYGFRVLALKEHGISEDDAMSMEYLSERKEKKKAYKRLKKLAKIQDKAPPSKPYLSANKGLQTRENNSARDRFQTPSVRMLVNQLKQHKYVLLQEKTGGIASQDHWIDE